MNHTGIRRWIVFASSAIVLAAPLALLAASANAQGLPGSVRVAPKSRGPQAAAQAEISPNKLGFPSTPPKALGPGPGVCHVRIVNKTDWVINFFVDDNYVGTIPRKGAIEFDTGNGATKVYGRADFDDKSHRDFGPVSGACQGSHTMNLEP